MHAALRGCRLSGGRLVAGSGARARLLPGVAPARQGRAAVRAVSVHEACMVVSRGCVMQKRQPRQAAADGNRPGGKVPRRPGQTLSFSASSVPCTQRCTIRDTQKAGEQAIEQKPCRRRP